MTRTAGTVSKLSWQSTSNIHANNDYNMLQDGISCHIIIVKFLIVMDWDADETDLRPQ